MADIKDEAGSWPVTRSSIEATGRIVTVRTDAVTLPDGEVICREVVEHPGAVAIVALDERDRVLLIRQTLAGKMSRCSASRCGHQRSHNWRTYSRVDL